MSHGWEWERTEPGRPGMSGDLAKIFRHEELKAPGVLAVDVPPDPATLLAREVIQNSWDAARELQAEDPNAPQFQIEFRFDDLYGDAKQSLLNALALDSLSSRVAVIDREKVGLQPRDCLDSVNDVDEPLRVLEITEQGATGMYGPWDQNKSHMFLALLSIGFTEKFSGAGGSYGYGKAGLINGSRIRSVVAYSCFRERADDSGITRRLLGVTYWGPHDFEGVNHPGIGTLSAGHAGQIRPFENDEADEIARQIGLASRTPIEAEDLGTTFLVIDTPVDPQDLVRAIERSWWPAIQEGDFVARIVDVDGSTLSPRPMRDPVLHTFIDAWEIAMRRSDPGAADWFARLTGPKDDPGLSTVGTMGLVADLAGWSYADHGVGPEDLEVSHKSLVALTRGPRMVVEYLEVGNSPPYLRGAFIADPSIDDLLRRTEPKGHDAWRTKTKDGEVDPRAAHVAGHVIARIKQTVQNHRTRIKPPVPPPEEVNLPFFNAIMQKVMSGMGPGVRQPVSDIRPLSIRLEHEPRESIEEGLIELAGSATYALSEHFDGDRTPVTLNIAYRFIEDDRVGEYAQLNISAPDGFTEREPGVFFGFLERDEEARFEFVSAPYHPTWSGRLIVNGQVIAGPSGGAMAE